MHFHSRPVYQHWFWKDFKVNDKETRWAQLHCAEVQWERSGPDGAGWLGTFQRMFGKLFLKSHAWAYCARNQSPFQELARNMIMLTELEPGRVYEMNWMRILFEVKPVCSTLRLSVDSAREINRNTRALGVSSGWQGPCCSSLCRLTTSCPLTTFWVVTDSARDHS